MKLLSSHFVAPAILATLSLLAGCSSDDPQSPPAAAGAGGAVGKAGASAGGASAGGASAGGAGGGVSSAGAGSGGTSTAGAGGGATVEASFNTVREMIRLQPCTGGGCHGEEGTPMPWGPDDPNLYTILTTHTTAHCGKLVNTANPPDSALIKVLLGDCGPTPRTNENTTPRMPYGKCYEGDNAAEIEACVSPAKVAAILAWITKGAPQQ
jgi:hypothetical protein